MLIHREDLAKSKSLVAMKLQDDENVITVITETFARINNVDDMNEL